MLVVRNSEWALAEVFEVHESFKFTSDSIIKQFHLLETHQRRNVKDEVFKILNKIITDQCTTQAQLRELERWVNRIGTELFTRFLTGFIYQQKRRYGSVSLAPDL